MKKQLKNTNFLSAKQQENQRNPTKKQQLLSLKPNKTKGKP